MKLNALQVKETTKMVLHDKPDILGQKTKNPSKGKVVSLRLPNDDSSFIESVRGDLLPGEAIKNIIKYLRQFDPNYTRNMLKEVIRIG